MLDVGPADCHVITNNLSVFRKKRFFYCNALLFATLLVRVII